MNQDVAHKGTQTIETERLILRKAQDGDGEFMYHNWASDAEVTKFMSWPVHESAAVSQYVLDSWINDYGDVSFYQWVIVLKDISEPIGSISVVQLREEIAEAEVGYCIGRTWWHKGIMSEALKAVIDYLFDEVGMKRIMARHDPNNPHSGGVMRKCGMKYEGTMRAAGRNNQGVCDALVYAITEIDRRKEENSELILQSLDDESIVQAVYRGGREDERLTKNKAAQVEFYTTIKYIEKYLTPASRILDIGAGTGVYSLYFAGKGYSVSALELADANIAVFRSKLTDDVHVDLQQGNALDLSRYEMNSFDIVLLFGPLYHLHEEKDRRKCIEEAKRVCKPDGKIFFAFIANDIVILTM